MKRKEEARRERWKEKRLNDDTPTIPFGFVFSALLQIEKHFAFSCPAPLNLASNQSIQIRAMRETLHPPSNPRPAFLNFRCFTHLCKRSMQNFLSLSLSIFSVLLSLCLFAISRFLIYIRTLWGKWTLFPPHNLPPDILDIINEEVRRGAIGRRKEVEVMSIRCHVN